MHRLAPLLVLLIACRSLGPVHPAQANGSPLRVLGETNPDSEPPSCRAHGGTPPVPSAPPQWARSARRDHTLDSLGIGRLFVYISAARTGEPLQSAALYLEPSLPGIVQGYVAGGGWAHLQAPGGRYALRIRSIQTREAILDSLDVRRGFADTLRLAVGQPWFCGL